MTVKQLLIVVGAALLLTGCGKAQKAYEKGMELATDGKYEKSLSYFEEAVSESSDRAEYYIGYGMALNRLGRYEEAEEKFQTVIQEKENKISKVNNKQIYYGIAISEYNLGEYDSVITYCQKALAIEYLEDMDCDILYTRMMAFCQQGEWEKAETDGKDIIDRDKKYMDAYLALARIERTLGENDMAVQVYQDAIEIDDTNYDMYFALYEQYCYAGQEDDAQQVLNRLTVLKPDKAENIMAVGRAYIYKEEYDKAEEYLNMAYDGNCGESKYYSGILYAKQGLYDEAIQAFQTYIEENKEDYKVEVYYQMALAYMEQEEYDKAQSAVNKGLAYGNSSVYQELKKAQVVLMEKQNNYQEALALAKEYQKRYPSDSGMKKEIKFIKTRIK